MSFQRLAVLYILHIIFFPSFIFFPKFSCILTNKCNQDAEGLTRIRKTFMTIGDFGSYISSAFPSVTGRLQCSCMGHNGHHINPGCYTAG